MQVVHQLDISLLREWKLWSRSFTAVSALPMKIKLVATGDRERKDRDHFWSVASVSYRGQASLCIKWSESGTKPEETDRKLIKLFVFAFRTLLEDFSSINWDNALLDVIKPPGGERFSTRYTTDSNKTNNMKMLLVINWVFKSVSDFFSLIDAWMTLDWFLFGSLSNIPARWVRAQNFR